MNLKFLQMPNFSEISFKDIFLTKIDCGIHSKNIKLTSFLMFSAPHHSAYLLPEIGVPPLPISEIQRCIINGKGNAFAVHDGKPIRAMFSALYGRQPPNNIKSYCSFFNLSTKAWRHIRVLITNITRLLHLHVSMKAWWHISISVIQFQGIL